MNAAAIVLLLAWTLFAFGGVYPWALVPALVLAAVGAAWSWSRASARAPGRGLGLLLTALLIAVVAAGVQLVPLPGEIRAVISPNEANYFARLLLDPPAAGVWRPLALSTLGWAWGIGVLVAAVCTFLWTSTTVNSRNARTLVRSIAWLGLIVSVVALVQPALFPSGKVYGFWTPQSQGIRAAGPIISRNHFAAWVILAWPLVVGGLVTHARFHWRGDSRRLASLILGDTRALWMMAAAALLPAALLVTQSRGGVIGFGVALLVLVGRTWKRNSTRGRISVSVFLVALALAVSMWASPEAVINRFDRAYSGIDGGRPEIWRETLTLIEQFPIAGIGLGAFEFVMPAYQQTSHVVLINHAHNQYLHILAEGGALVAIPLAVALFSLVGLIRRRLRADDTPMIHVREGAVAGLVGLAVASLFDVPSLTPAVALLAAVSAALAAHVGDVTSGERA